MDYKAALPAARRVYTEEMIAGARANASAENTDARPSMPTYLVELHNRMAVVTK